MDTRGQILLRVKIEQENLTLHIKSARQLRSPHPSGCCSAFIRIVFFPEDNQYLTKEDSDIVRNTTDPHFDERFTFELADDDWKKRVVVSVWSMDFTTKRCECIGSTSYGIQSLMKNSRMIDGWYFLLDAETGMNKHSAVSNSKPVFTKPSHGNPRTFSLTLFPQKAGGYGFSLGGGRPTFVSAVVPGSPAHVKGILPGDVILRINNINMADSYCDTVQQIMQNCDMQLNLELRRGDQLPEHQESCPQHHQNHFQNHYHKQYQQYKSQRLPPREQPQGQLSQHPGQPQGEIRQHPQPQGQLIPNQQPQGHLLPYAQPQVSSYPQKRSAPLGQSDIASHPQVPEALIKPPQAPPPPAPQGVQSEPLPVGYIPPPMLIPALQDEDELNDSKENVAPKHKFLCGMTIASKRKKIKRKAEKLKKK